MAKIFIFFSASVILRIFAFDMIPVTMQVLISIILLFAAAWSGTLSASAEISGTLPVVYIETANHTPVTSKIDYLDATFRLDPMGISGVSPVGSASEPVAMQIRGRGHSSWKGIKKPYKLKFPEKTPLLGMPKNKHWALIKPVEGNAAGLYLGKILNMAWTPSFRPVEVVLNNDYIGLYFLMETIRIGKNRVDIYEQADNETDPELITGGWLVEVDNYWEYASVTFQENDNWNITIKPHSPENLSAVQRNWLTDELVEMNTAIYSADKQSTDWENYLDVESIARYFIIQEVLDNPDGFHGSFYLHKDLGDGTRWVAGPVWDMLCYYREKEDYTFRLKAHYNVIPHWVGELIQYNSFCVAVENAWKEIYPDKINTIFDHIDNTLGPLANAWTNDCLRWGDDPEQYGAEFRIDRLKTYLRNNIDWFNGHLPRSGPTSTSTPLSDAPGPVKAYTLQGVYVGEYTDESAALARLPRGIYIINQKKCVKN